MKIRELNINNFRIFKGPYNFNFKDKNLIIIYGSNGNGKSTLFDSIEWVITGELLRYKGSNERNKFNYIFNNKVYGTKNCEVFVEIIFDHNKEELNIKRICRCNINGVEPKTTIIINGTSYKEQEGNQKIRELIMKNSDSEGIFDKSKFRDMFSATQLLSQDEIADFVSSKRPSDRLLVMEKILGVDKYGEDFRQYIKENINNINEINEGKEKDKADLEKKSIKITNEIGKVYTKISTMEEQNKNLGVKNELEVLNDLKTIRNSEMDLKVGNCLQEYNSIDNQVQNELIKHKDNIENEISKSKILLEDIIKYEDDYKKSKEIKTLKLNLESLNKNLKQKSIKRKLSINYYENKINELKSVLIFKEEIENYNKVNLDNRKSILLKKQQIESLKKLDILSGLEKKYGELDKFYSEFINKEIQVSKINELITYMSLKIETCNIDEKNKKSEEELRKLQNDLVKVQDNSKNIKEKLDAYNSKADEETKSISQMVYEIQNDIIEKKEIDTCPVCGEAYETSNKLIEKIEYQLNKSKEYFTDIQNIIRNLLSQKNKYLEDERIIKNKIDEITSEYKRNSDLLTEKRVQVEKTRIEHPKKDIYLLMNESIEKLKDLNKYIDENKVAIELIRNTRKIQSEIEELQKDFDLILEKIREIEFKYHISPTYANKTKKMIEDRDKKYKKYIEIVRESLKSIDTEINKNSYNINDFEKYLIQLKIDEERIVKRIQSFISEEKNIEQCIYNVKENIELLESIEKDIKISLNNINLIFSREELKKLKEEKLILDNEKEKADKFIIALNQEIQKNNNDINGLTKISEDSKEIQSELIGNLIENYSDFIDKLFFQISPHAFAKHIYMIPRKTDLYIILSEKRGRRKALLELTDEELKKEANASLTLSSAQKNVLGICIFISLSLSQSWTKIDMMGIDDPFQNMDDINVYSFLDTLSGVLDKKQVMISTHNEDFAALISNKSALERSKIKVIELETYSEDGVKYSESDLI